MSRRIMLIYPPSPPMLREDRCQIPARNPVFSPDLPPMDLLSLAAVAETAGHSCKVADYSRNGSGSAALRRDLQQFRPDILCISVTTPTLQQDLSVCAMAKEMLPAVLTVAKGAHFLVSPNLTLAEFPALDVIIRGETEGAFRELVEGRQLAEIAGISYWSPEGPISTRIRPFIEDLDSLPYPARHLVDNQRYKRPDNGKPLGVIKVSRGCPYHCFFCLATPVSGSKVRMRSPQSIVGEIVLCVERFGMRDFIFWADFFTCDRAWVLELCNEILRSGVQIAWSANTRVSSIDRELAEMMNKSGCSLLSLGVESGNQAILDMTGKGTTIAQIREAFQTVRRAGIMTVAYFLIGLPWETRSTFDDTMRLALELRSDFASFFVATPLPGTRFYDFALQHRLYESNGESAPYCFADAYYRPSVRGLYLSKNEIAEFQREAVRRFLLRPEFILKSLGRIRSVGELIGYSRAAFCAIRGAAEG